MKQIYQNNFKNNNNAVIVKVKNKSSYKYTLCTKVAIFYYVSMEKLLEQDTFKLKQFKHWLGENTILTTRVWPNDNYAVQCAA